MSGGGDDESGESSSETAAYPSDPLLLVGAVFERKYRLDRVVAEGGFGVVYHGYHLAFEVPVAVKVLKPPRSGGGSSGGGESTAEEVLRRFVQEAQTIARLRHPAIVQVLDSGVFTPPDTTEGHPFMVLEWLEGVTLGDALEARRGKGGRSPDECLRLLRPVLEAIAFAHENGIAHRDLKPSNVMIVAGAHGPNMRVLDFGIAKVMRPNEDVGSGSTQTQAALRAFTMLYAAPEQVSGSRTGPWTDVHALGLLLTEVLTDGPPYPSADAMELYQLVFHTERPTPAKFGVAVGPWEQILAKATALKPGDRFAKAGELLAALDATVHAASEAWKRRPPVATWTGPRATSERHTALAAATTLPVTSVPSSQDEPVATSPRTARRWPVAAVVVGGTLGAMAVMTWAARSGQRATAADDAMPLGPSLTGLVTSAATVGELSSAAPLAGAFTGDAGAPATDAAAAHTVAEAGAHVLPRGVGAALREPRDKAPNGKPHASADAARVAPSAAPVDNSNYTLE